MTVIKLLTEIYYYQREDLYEFDMMEVLPIRKTIRMKGTDIIKKVYFKRLKLLL